MKYMNIMKKYLEDQDAVKKAYLQLMVQGEDESYLIVLDYIGDKKEVLDAIIHDAGKRGIVCRLSGLTDQDREELELLFPEANVQPFFDKLTDMTSGTVEGMETGKEYRAFPIT